MKTEKDEWGRDFSVQRMRQVFSRMEAAQRQLFEQVNISPLDRRLRRVRDSAKGLFERTWSLAARRGVNVGEEEAVGIYLYCLVHALGLIGVEVPEEFLTNDEQLKSLVGEALKWSG